MKLLIVVGIIFCSGMIGYGFANSYKRKRLFYFELIDMINKLQNYISFTNKDLKEILESINFKTDLEGIVKAYLDFIDNKEDYKEYINKLNIINDEEKNNLTNFFDCLGKYNASTQISELENHKKHFEVQYEEMKAKENKYYSLNIKLGIIIGAGISLLII